MIKQYFHTAHKVDATVHMDEVAASRERSSYTLIKTASSTFPHIKQAPSDSLGDRPMLVESALAPFCFLPVV